ncbi:MAG: redoxin domain-containing protein [Bacteroidota bacterium]
MKNKRQLLFFVFCFLFLFYSCGNNNENSNYQIKGTLTNSSGEFVSLVDVNSSEIKTIDSVKVNERGEFIFNKKVPEKGFYSIQISSSNYATIIADSTENIFFEGNAKNLNEGYTVSGSNDSETLLRFNDFTKKNFKKMESSRMKQDSLRRVYEAYLNTTPDSLFLDSISKMLEPVFNSFSEDYRKLADETNEYIRNFVNENVSSFASLAAVQMLNPDKDIAYLIKVSNALTAKYPTVENLKGFKKYVDSKKNLAIGSPAPEITLNNKDGIQLSLSSLKGKIVIVDFWASWCKPCRAENPFMVSLYNKYKDKGLDIFSVALDFKKEAWLEAIAKDKLSWKNHVSDLKQWQSPVVSLYGFEGIPFTCLLDKEGNIAGKNLRGPELEEKIKELLD